ncbi:MAG: YIP1 family protein [Candidatus Obscuribacterales bacterium]|nr:YIP1 family protein [Candidatus Obscuribacterales bacterium]
MDDGDKPNSSPTSPAAPLIEKLPPSVRSVVEDYFGVTRSLLLAPIVFYRGMDKEGGFKHPVIYLAISSGASALLAGILTLHPLSIPATLATSMMLTFAASGIAFGLSRAMGGKGSFEATFKVYAYSSCLTILSAIPLLNLLSIFWIAALNFYGLREVQERGTLRTAVIIMLTSMLLTVLSVAHYLHIF